MAKVGIHMTFFKAHSQLFLHFYHSPHLDPKIPFQKPPSGPTLFLPHVPVNGQSRNPHDGGMKVNVAVKEGKGHAA